MNNLSAHRHFGFVYLLTYVNEFALQSEKSVSTLHPKIKEAGHELISFLHVHRIDNRL